MRMIANGNAATPLRDWDTAPVPVDSRSGMTNTHTMPKSKIAITMDGLTVRRLDRLVTAGAHASRSEAVERAVEEYLARRERSRLARECGKLDSAVERALAEEGIAGDGAEWPAY